MPDPTPTPDPQPAPPADPAPAPPAPPAPTPTSTPPADPNPADDGKGGKDAILADLAKERDARQALQQQINDMQAAQQAQMDALATALGIKKDDAPPDPAVLTGQIETEKSSRQAAERQLAVYRVAADPAVAANASRLLDSSSFLASIKDIDPTDTAALTEKVKAAVEADAVFRAAGATPTTPPFPGGPRPPAPIRAGSLSEAIQNRISQPNR